MENDMKSIFRISRKKAIVIGIVMCGLFYTSVTYSENGEREKLILELIRGAFGPDQPAGKYPPNFSPPQYPVNMPYQMPNQTMGCPMGTMPLQTMYGVMCCNVYGCL
jgi:hypothetical protein